MLLVMLATLPAIGVIVHDGWEHQRANAEEAKRDALRLANRLAASQRRLIDRTRQVLLMLSELPQVRDVRGPGCAQLLAKLMAHSSYYANFGVINARGDVVCSAIASATPVNVSDRSYFRAAIESRTFVMGEYQIGRVSGEPVIVFAYPLIDDRGVVASVVFAALSIKWFGIRLAETALPEGTSLTVVNEAHTVLAHFPEATEWTGKRVVDWALLRHMETVAAEGSVEALGLDGTRRLHAFARLADLPGNRYTLVVVGIPSEAAYGAVRREVLRNILIVVILAALITSIAWWGGAVFVLRGIGQLRSAATEFARGNFAAQAPMPRASREVAELAIAFNDMAASLERQIDQVTRLNRVYAVLSGINGALLRIRDRGELLREVCRIGVRRGGFVSAWVAFVDADGAELRMAATDGTVPDDILAWLGAQLSGGSRLEATLLGRRQHLVLNRVQGGPAGTGSCAAFPLIVEDRAIGVLGLCAREPDFFDASEIRLLQEMAADASLGLEYIGKDRRLSELAYVDSVTGLANRRLFSDRIDQAVARARHRGRYVGVLIAKLRRFRDVNESMGYAAGDDLLRAVARFLASTVRDGDTVARATSSEFGVVFADVSSPEHIQMIASKVVDGFPNTVRSNGEDIFCSVAVGAAVFPQDGQDAATLIKNAELALRSIEKDAENAVSYFSSEMDQEARSRRIIERELRGALERRELRLHYQPIVSTADRSIVGVEALLRWHNALLGDVSPAQFIPVAEDTGLIVPIGEWVLKTACAQALEWKRDGVAALKVSVNLSVVQLKQDDIVERLQEMIRTAGFNATDTTLGIEITESQLIQNMGVAVDRLTQLRGVGLTVAIDDFGTGYSSLSYLRQLPIDTLKIDRSFISAIATSSDALAIVKGIIALGRSLGLQLIAEGVETEEQLRLLSLMNCHGAQGFLFGAPQAAEQLRERLPRA